jgi:hypothetical protein
MSDVVYTPDWCAADMVRHFKPFGRILEPCKGGGAFLRYLPESCDWCEIAEGRDFFDWRDRVDWIITNPPYSITKEFIRHALAVSDHVAFLLPARNFFSSLGKVRVAKGWGGLAEMRWYGGGARLNFPMGNPIAAFYWKRGHNSGLIRETHYEDEAALFPSTDGRSAT